MARFNIYVVLEVEQVSSSEAEMEAVAQLDGLGVDTNGAGVVGFEILYEQTGQQTE